ncbi:MAG: hypothetical protein SX243_01835 [Acidobacteriota bacterium]|nr:hypothetical protein [Acidobacteriota bacterium]
MSERDSKPAALGDLLDRVSWDYDPEAERLSPLVSTERYFRDFPWEPEGVFETPAKGPAPNPEASQDTSD